MNNTLITWVLGAAVAALGLVLLLGTPAAEPADATLDANAAAANGAAAETATYWQAVTTGAAVPVATYAASTPVPAPSAGTPCASCSTATGASHAVYSAAITTPHAAAAAVTAPAHSTSAVPGLRGGCGTPAAACASTPCGPVASCSVPTCSHTAGACAATCGQPASCLADPCDNRPRINRNGPACVDECAFAQFTSTVALPVCSSIRFAWAATRGEFLDPTSPTPVYYAPSTGFPGGEDVLITLTVKDAQGNEYVDQMKLHINDVQ